MYIHLNSFFIIINSKVTFQIPQNLTPWLYFDSNLEGSTKTIINPTGIKFSRDGARVESNRPSERKYSFSPGENHLSLQTRKKFAAKETDACLLFPLDSYFFSSCSRPTELLRSRSCVNTESLHLRRVAGCSKKERERKQERRNG